MIVKIICFRTAINFDAFDDDDGLPAHHPTNLFFSQQKYKNSNLVSYNNHMIIHTKHGHPEIMNYINLNSFNTKKS